MNKFNPIEFFQNAFSKENLNEHQLKAQELVQTINSEAQKQIAKVPERLQEGISVAQENLNSFNDAVKKTASNFQNPQSLINVWSNHFQTTYQRNLALLQKQHQENVDSITDIKTYFENTSDKIKTDTEANFKKIHETTTEAIGGIQKNIEAIQSELKDNLNNIQKQTSEGFTEAVKQTTAFNTKVQDQVNKGISAFNQTVESTQQAAQEVNKVATTKKTTKN